MTLKSYWENKKGISDLFSHTGEEQELLTVPSVCEVYKKMMKGTCKADYQ